MRIRKVVEERQKEVEMVREGTTGVVTAAMVVAQFFEVGSNTLTKTATTDGMSIFVYTVYSNLLALCFLLPSTFLYHRKRPPPPISTSIFFRIFLLSCLRYIYIYMNKVIIAPN